MNADIHKLVTECDPCQRHHRSAPKEIVETSHQSMFNLWPGNTVHMDFCKYNGVDFVFIVDRLTRYIHCERTPNQCSSSEILAVNHWSNRNGLPYKVISDTVEGFRDEFIKQAMPTILRAIPS